jgi:TorA maturation chaperone TorD
MQGIMDSVCQRADSYQLLSACYYLPDAELLQKIVDEAQNNHFFNELACCIASDTELESLIIDYTRLFVGPFKLLAPPYGSVYLEDGKVMGQSTVDVRNWYEKEGLDIVINDAPDHIAMELEFMYYLAVKQIQATRNEDAQGIEGSQKKQKSFLCSHLVRWVTEFAENVEKNAETHLARWVTEFAENVEKNAETKFYKTLAQLTEMFVQMDVQACTLLSTVHHDSTGG